MTNAIKMLLKRKKISQTTLANEIHVCKQSISKWLLGHKPIPYERRKELISILEISEEIFYKYCINKKGYCISFNVEEELEFEDFLRKKEYEGKYRNLISKYPSRQEIENMRITNLEELEAKHKLYREMNYLDDEYMKISRNHQISSDVRKLVKRFKNDIWNYDDNQMNGIDPLDVFENNIIFYEKFFDLKESKKISINEWQSIYEALLLICNGTENIQRYGNELTRELFRALRKNRSKQKEKQEQDMKDYKECFGDISIDELDKSELI